MDNQNIYKKIIYEIFDKYNEKEFDCELLSKDPLNIKFTSKKNGWYIISYTNFSKVKLFNNKMKEYNIE